MARERAASASCGRRSSGPYCRFGGGFRHGWSARNHSPRGRFAGKQHSFSSPCVRHWHGLRAYSPGSPGLRPTPPSQGPAASQKCRSGQPCRRGAYDPCSLCHGLGRRANRAGSARHRRLPRLLLHRFAKLPALYAFYGGQAVPRGHGPNQDSDAHQHNREQPQHCTQRTAHLWLVRVPGVGNGRSRHRNPNRPHLHGCGDVLFSLSSRIHRPRNLVGRTPDGVSGLGLAQARRAYGPAVYF